MGTPEIKVNPISPMSNKGLEQMTGQINVNDNRAGVAKGIVNGAEKQGSLAQKPVFEAPVIGAQPVAPAAQEVKPTPVVK